MAATIVHDPSEAVALCPVLGLYLKPIAKVTISVSLPPPRTPGRPVSNWEVMERLKGMVGGAGAGAGSGAASGAGSSGSGGSGSGFSALRIAKSSLDFVRFEGELENRALARAAIARLDGKTMKLSGFPDALCVRATESRLDSPARRDRNAEDGERPDTIHLEGLPCRWFARRDPPALPGATFGPTSASGGGTSVPISCSGTSGSTSRSMSSATGSVPGTSGTTSVFTSCSGGVTSGSTSGPGPERPSEALLRQAFGAFGDIRRVDIPMLDPYRAEASGRGFPVFSLGGHLNFEAYVQYREPAGFERAMAALRGAKLMFRGEDGKAVACSIKVSSDATRHLSDAAIRRRQLERQKLQELERRREEQKRREKEAEERQRAEERRQREAEQQERARRREEKLRRREQRAREREQRRSRRREERRRAERARGEEHRLALARRRLQSLRLVAALLGRAGAARRREQTKEERRRRAQEAELREEAGLRCQEVELRRQQEAELRRVEEEKRRALGLQRRERELRHRLLSLLLARGPGHAPGHVSGHAHDLLRPVLDVLRGVAQSRVGAGTLGIGSDIIGTGSDIIGTGNDAIGIGSGQMETESDSREASNGSGVTGSNVITRSCHGETRSNIKTENGQGGTGNRSAVTGVGLGETGSDIGTESGSGGPGSSKGGTEGDITDIGIILAPPKATPTLEHNKEPELRPTRKPREGVLAEEQGVVWEQRRPRETDGNRGRDPRRSRKHREDQDHSRSPRPRTAWDR